ncbi:hypothetical protein D3C75_513250 [compost metagenome]
MNRILSYSDAHIRAKKHENSGSRQKKAREWMEAGSTNAFCGNFHISKVIGGICIQQRQPYAGLSQQCGDGRGDTYSSAYTEAI